MTTMHKYNPSTQNRIGEIRGGIRTETPVLTGTATYFTAATDYDIFNIVGMVQVEALYWETTTVFSADATTKKLQAVWTTPTIAKADIGAASASMASSAVGERVTWQATTAATAMVVSDPGISIVPPPGILGGVTGDGTNYVGVINVVVATSQGSGSAAGRWVCHYFPLSEGAYVESAI